MNLDLKLGGKDMYKRIAAIGIVLLMVCQILPLTVLAIEQTDWMLDEGMPKISFLDEEGNPLSEELNYVDAGDRRLSFDESKVSFMAGEAMDYASVNLYIECVDYNFYVAEELPDDQKAFARLDIGGRSVNEDVIAFSVDEHSGCLKVTVEFCGITPFENENDQITLFVQYLSGADDDAVTHKGEVSYVFTQRIKAAQPEEKDENLNVEIILPEEQEELEIRSKTPYILLEDCSIGDGWKTVPAGSTFDFHLNLKNTHKRLSIENLQLSVATEDDLYLAQGGNRFYLGNIKKDGELEYTLKLSAAPTAKAKVHAVKLKLDYEYVDEDTRRYETSEIEVKIPISQSLKLIVDPIQVLPEYAITKEHEIYSPFANHSHNVMYYVTATLKSDIHAHEKVIHLGNLSAGEGGSTRFALLPQKTGTYPVTITYTYEDEWGVEYSEFVEAEIICVDAPAEEEEISQLPYIVTLPQGGSDTEGKAYLTLLAIAAATLVILIAVLFNNFRKEH